MAANADYSPSQSHEVLICWRFKLLGIVEIFILEEVGYWVAWLVYSNIYVTEGQEEMAEDVTRE